MAHTITIGEYLAPPLTLNETPLTNTFALSNQKTLKLNEWQDFIQATNLESLFNIENGINPPQQGQLPLKTQHLEHVSEKYDQYLQKVLKKGEVPLQNHNMQHLIWLKFWLNWSILNCQNPTIHIS